MTDESPTPDLEDEVRSGAVLIEAVAALAQILGDPRFKAESAKWRTLARESVIHRAG